MTRKLLIADIHIKLGQKNVPKDWPDISKKPVDPPFGPYVDVFSEQQHKYGPFKPIADAQKKREAVKK